MANGWASLTISGTLTRTRSFHPGLPAFDLDPASFGRREHGPLVLAGPHYFHQTGCLFNPLWPSRRRTLSGPRPCLALAWCRALRPEPPRGNGFRRSCPFPRPASNHTVRPWRSIWVTTLFKGVEKHRYRYWSSFMSPQGHVGVLDIGYGSLPFVGDAVY